MRNVKKVKEREFHNYLICRKFYGRFFISLNKSLDDNNEDPLPRNLILWERILYAHILLLVNILLYGSESDTRYHTNLNVNDIHHNPGRRNIDVTK